MKPITRQDLQQDLLDWLAADAAAVEQARLLRGGGGWEQWSLIQFLRFQTNRRGADLNYQREFPLAGLKRRFDIGYNCVKGDAPADAQHPVILTQWKCGNDGNNVSMEITKDLGTLSEGLGAGLGSAPKVTLPSKFCEPYIVALCPESLIAAKMNPSGAIANTAVRLQLSTDDTLGAYGIVPARG